jgi:hypothetical protein
MSDTSSSDPFNSSGSSSSGIGSGALSFAGPAVGALGLGALLAQGPGSLPVQYQQLENNVPGMEQEATSLETQGGTLTGQGTQALQMAQNGQLTPEQQAQLSLYQTGLTNQSRQQFAAMGRNPDQDTAFINQTANIDTQVNAMAQQQIQSTIQLGLGELSSGSSLIGQGLGFENAANQALIAAGQAQIQLDTSYSTNLTSAFSAIGTLFGAATKVATVSDIRMKKDIGVIGQLFDGTPVYRFQYIDAPGWQIGVMAQDIEKFAPEAVIDIGGIKHVDIEKATERALRA